MFQISRYGWQPDLPDQRDYRYTAPLAVVAKLPEKTDLRPGCPPVYDQGQLGSCTANAISAAFEFDLIGRTLPLSCLPGSSFTITKELLSIQ